MAGDSGDDLSDLITSSGADGSGGQHCYGAGGLTSDGDECDEPGGEGGALRGASPAGGITNCGNGGTCSLALVGPATGASCVCAFPDSR